jgi:hypothetical protein
VLAKQEKHCHLSKPDGVWNPQQKGWYVPITGTLTAYITMKKQFWTLLHIHT